MARTRNRENVELNNQGLKKCSKCQRILPLERFPVHKDKADGRCYQCRDCRRRHSRNRVRLQVNLWTAWLQEIYGITPTCQICGKTLEWRTGAMRAPNFDHRHGHGLIISCGPNVWTRDHPLTETNKAIWLFEDFGILCGRCNQFLPTHNRREFLRKATDYTK